MSVTLEWKFERVIKNAGYIFNGEIINRDLFLSRNFTLISLSVEYKGGIDIHEYIMLICRWWINQMKLNSNTYRCIILDDIISIRTFNCSRPEKLSSVIFANSCLEIAAWIDRTYTCIVYHCEGEATSKPVHSLPVAPRIFSSDFSRTRWFIPRQHEIVKLFFSKLRALKISRAHVMRKKIAVTSRIACFLLITTKLCTAKDFCLDFAIRIFFLSFDKKNLITI